MAIGDRVKGLSAELLQALITRLELFGLELQQARQDLPRLLALWVVGLLSLMFAMAIFTLFVVSLTWDTPYRDWVVLALFLIYAAVGGGLIWHVRQRLRADGLNPFAVTLEELNRDVRSLMYARLDDQDTQATATSNKDKDDRP